MGSAIEEIDKAFQRILRWFYPGLLLILLFSLFFHTESEFIIKTDWEYWFIILALFAAGAVVYLFQNYVITQFLSFCTLIPRIPGLSWINNCFQYFATIFIDHFIEEEIFTEYPWKIGGNYRYSQYSWAAYHACMITGWLPLVFMPVAKSIFCCNYQNSLLYNYQSWVIGVCVSFIVFGVYIYALNRRITYKIYKYSHRHKR